MNIIWNTAFPILKKDRDISKFFKEMTVLIDSDKLELSYLNQEEAILEADDKNKNLTDDIKVDVTFMGTGNDDKTIYIEFKIDIPTIMFTTKKDSVIVEMNMKRLFYKKDSLIHLRMGYPTKDMLLSVDFKDGNNDVYCGAFGFDARAHKIKQGKNSGFVNIKEWILPGQGATISWRPVD